VKIGVQNLSTLVSNLDAYAMTLLANAQLRREVAPAWGLAPPSVAYLAQGAQGTRYDAIIGILDDSDQAGALGWHTEGPDATVYGRVFARPVLSNGGNVLTAALSVCGVLSHEAIETFLDSACNRWAQRNDGTLVAVEGCDPVESDSYMTTITAPRGGGQVAGTVSDFVLPSWFDPDAAAGSTDWMGLVTAPFQVRDTGYIIVMANGRITSQWGAHYPRWRIATKEHATARTARREGGRHGHDGDHDS
jgi:hypothetical protein